MKKLIAASVSLVAVAAVAVPLALGAGAAKVNVTLKEFTVKPTPKTVAAGKVTFAVKNAGALEHELIVIKTNVPAGKLPVKNGRASEKGSVGEIELKPKKSGALTLNLKAGKYVLICNVSGHYKAGQYTSFTVK
ncbi:MAG: hypothetical protein U0R50_07515 [Gaiellales bacterium]